MRRLASFTKAHGGAPGSSFTGESSAIQTDAVAKRDDPPEHTDVEGAVAPEVRACVVVVVEIPRAGQLLVDDSARPEVDGGEVPRVGVHVGSARLRVRVDEAGGEGELADDGRDADRLVRPDGVAAAVIVEVDASDAWRGGLP